MRFYVQNKQGSHIPWTVTEILNKKECGVASVGISLLGQLKYRNQGCMLSSVDVHHTIILQSKLHKENCYEYAVEADFDIYTTDGRVIEVHTFDRKLLEAAIKLVPVKNIRSRSRAQRGIV